MRRGWISRLVTRLGGDHRGTAAVEFAFTAPLLLVVYLGGFEITQAIAAYRKVSDTTVELANVATQYTSMGSADVSTVFNASSQIITPYPMANLTIILSVIQTDQNSNATITWSKSNNGTTTLAAGTAVALPTGLASPNGCYVLVQTTYVYTPVVGVNYLSAVPLADQMYMLPRASACIPYTG